MRGSFAVVHAFWVGHVSFFFFFCSPLRPFKFKLLVFVPVLLAVIASGDAFNPCLVDETACVPLEDFQENCTCLLVTKPFNASGDVFVFFDGYPVPFSYFTQVRLEKLFKEKLGLRLPQKHNFEHITDLPDTVYRNLDIEENMSLFTANSSLVPRILSALIDEGYLRTKALMNSSSRWCAEGECNAFVYESDIFNKSSGIYSHAADVLQVIEYRGRSLFATSNVFGKFDVPKIHVNICGNRCKPYHFSEHSVCLKRCHQGLKYDQVAVTGELKRNFDFFVRASAIHNIRDKYADYIPDYPR